jgi:crotonobetainyl-CoA:carnitine CoA-transferase CaiB-like acyl-CoA transferase
MAEDAPRGILDGVLIVEMTTAVFGPYATMLLGDLGAEVIRVENRGGDNSRNFAGARNPGMSPIFMSFNRNKRSIALDLSDPEDMAVMKGLIAKADVFVHAVRAGGAARLGLDYEGCKALKPDIVHVHCVGYGSGGRYAGRMAYDDMIQGAAGFTQLAPRIDPEAAPQYWPVLAGDKIAALHAAYAILAALFDRQRTGRGQAVEAPMYEAATFFSFSEHLFGETFVPPTGPLGYVYNVDPERRPYRTKDGWLSMFMFPRVWREFCQWGGRPDLLDDPDMQAYGRGEPVMGLWELLQKVTRNRTTDEWLDILERAGVPAMRAATLEEVLHDPHLNESGFFQVREHPTEGAYRTMAHPVAFHGAPASIRLDPPRLNQDEAYVRALALGKAPDGARTAPHDEEV